MFLAIISRSKDKVPETWIRKQTLVNAEYITEESRSMKQKL